MTVVRFTRSLSLTGGAALSAGLVVECGINLAR